MCEEAEEEQKAPNLRAANKVNVQRQQNRETNTTYRSTFTEKVRGMPNLTEMTLSRGCRRV